MYQWDFHVVWANWDIFLEGIWLTFYYTIITTITGLAFGVVVGLGCTSSHRAVSVLSRCIIEPFRCTPVLVQLFWFTFAFPVLFGITMTYETAAILTLTLYGGSFYAEIVRGGVISIDPGQKEAGQALGMKKWQVMHRIILPQAFKRMVPPLVNQTVLQLKNTSMLAMISVAELFYFGKQIADDSGRALEVYTAIAVMYFIIIFPIVCLSDRLETKVKTN